MVESKERTVAKEIDVTKVRPNPFCVRVESPKIDRLKESIAKYGLLSPITVRESPKTIDSYEIVFGHRRFAAVVSLGWKHIPAELAQVSDEQMIVFALTENLEREAYSDYEIGTYLRRLREEFGQTVETIAQMIGRSKAYVSDHISMTHLLDGVDNPSESVQVLRQITERQARILARLDDPRRRMQLARLAISENLGLKELDRLAGRPRLVSGEGEEVGHAPFAESSRPSANNLTDEKRITLMIEEIIEGLSNKDLSRLNSHRFKKLFSLFDEFPPMSSLLNYDKAFEHNWNTLRQMKDLRLDCDGLRVSAFGKFAYATFFVTYRMRYSGKWSVLRSRVTFVLTKGIDDDWLIIHEHWSLCDYDSIYSFVQKLGESSYIKYPNSQ